MLQPRENTRIFDARPQPAEQREDLRRWLGHAACARLHIFPLVSK
jgi:hypothetical protein